MTDNLPRKAQDAPLSPDAFADGSKDVNPDSVALLAAALRADAADLESYERVLAATIAAILPEGMLEIVRDRAQAKS
jgi:hypothetical protein